MAGDWNQTGTESDESAIAEAYAQEGTTTHDLDVSRPVHGFASAESTSSHHQVASDGTARATSFTHVVAASSAFSGVCQTDQTGCISHAKSQAGAKMVKHYESLKAGRATGSLSMSTSHSGPNPYDFPEDTITVAAGSSLIEATYSRSADQWSIGGTLYTATGTQQINQLVSGFGNLDEDWNFNQGVPKGSSFSIIAKTNNGDLGDQFHMGSGGTANTVECEIKGSAILNTIINIDH